MRRVNIPPHHLRRHTGEYFISCTGAHLFGMLVNINANRASQPAHTPSIANRPNTCRFTCRASNAHVTLGSSTGILVHPHGTSKSTSIMSRCDRGDGEMGEQGSVQLSWCPGRGEASRVSSGLVKGFQGSSQSAGGRGQQACGSGA